VHKTKVNSCRVSGCLCRTVLVVDGTQPRARGAEVLAAASAALAATSAALLADRSLYDSSLKVRTLQAKGR
jgi:hypothetical protein